MLHYQRRGDRNARWDGNGHYSSDKETRSTGTIEEVQTNTAVVYPPTGVHTLLSITNFFGQNSIVDKGMEDSNKQQEG